VRHRSDKPMLAMQKALNEIVGRGPMPMAFIRDAWLFYVGDRDWGTYEALEQCQALWPESISLVWQPSAGNRRILYVNVKSYLEKLV